MTDFSKLMEKAKEIESKMKESQENIKKIEVEGVSGADDVKVTLNGEGTMISIKISENVLSNDLKLPFFKYPYLSKKSILSNIIVENA